MKTDAQTFADWGVDMLRFDGCHSDYKDSPFGKMNKFLLCIASL